MHEHRRIPGPSRLELLKIGGALKRDFLGTMTELERRYGGLVRLPIPGRAIHILFEPDFARHVFKDNHRNYIKNTEAYQEYYPLAGDGLVLINGEDWRRKRRIVGGEFSAARVHGHLATIERFADGLVERLHSLTPANIDVYAEFSRLTLLIAGQTLFGTSVEDQVELLGTTAHDYTRYVTDRLTSFYRLPSWVPTPRRQALLRRIAELDRVVYGIIDQGDPATRGNGKSAEHSDVLSRLGNARPPAPALNRKEVRDQVVTLLLAAHDTTTSLLTWTLWLLARHPEALQRALAEQRHCEEHPSVDAFFEMEYLESVIREALRLYPPAPLVSRTAVEADTVGGHPIPAGSMVLYPFYVTHRLERFWPDAERFDPDRFSESQRDRHYPFSYFPFGHGGTRACIGEELALFEAKVILAKLLRAFDFGPAPTVETELAVTLRPKDGLRLQLTPRRNSSA